jgi:DNA-binding SARP family transcriptional activator
VEFRLLGPVEIWAGDRRILVPRRQERFVLAILLLEAGRPVPADRLAELAWGGLPPAGARGALRTCVSRLRGTLSAGAAGMGPLVIAQGGGYLIDVPPETVDAHRFSALVGRAQEATRPGEQAGLLRQALALWRGPAIADAGSPRARERLARPLEQRRAYALDLRIRADLACGRHADLVSELSGLVAADPLDETLAGHLMLSQYRAGRRHNSLETYESLSRRLRETLGLDPGIKLRELHTAILRAESAWRPLRIVSVRVPTAVSPAGLRLVMRPGLPFRR